MATKTKLSPSLKLFSPAKVNLFFRVLSKRVDGYHEIASLMQKTDFGDTLSFSLSEKSQYTCTEPSLGFDQSNLIIKAIDLFKKETGKEFELDVHLDKQIPMGAGLGGGSSNAATTLDALNQLLDVKLSKKDLMTLGAKLGADVPFFFSDGCAYCTGIGEIIEEIKRQPLYFEVKKPKDLSLSTPLVYKHCKPNAVSNIDPNTLLDLYQKDIDSFVSSLVNDLESPAFQLEKKLRLFKQSLFDQGCKQVVMTGSGTAFVCF